MKKDKDTLNYSRVCIGRMFIYQVCEDGTVIKTSRKMHIESKVTPYLKRGKATVKINGKEHTVKNLVAAHFLDGYTKGAYVEVVGADPFDCAVWNLRLYTKKEHGHRTGGNNRRSQRVIANGIEYRSIRQCAKALNASYQTVLDYLNGRAKHSVLRGISISLAK